MQYRQDNARNNDNDCYWYSVLINEHPPDENETSFALKNDVFDKMV